MKLTWLVVADSSKARIFLTDSRTGPIKEIESIVHTEARLHEQDMTSDLSGRSKGSGDGGNVYQHKIGPKDQENINFAKSIANALDDARKKEKFKQIILVSPPDFLGNLRNNLNSQTRKLVFFELAKNLSQLKAEEINEHLSESLKKYKTPVT